MDTRWSLEMENSLKHNPLWVNMKYYSVERKSREMVLHWFRDNCSGKCALDYCCGNGEDARIIAKYGARKVVGIDVSEVSIQNCIRLAAEEGLDTITTYLVQDAENTGFEDNSFDIIAEYGALHHLDLEKAYAELSRILRPDGKIICNEAVAHNPLIHSYRKMTPHLRTPWEVEHILRKKDFQLASKYFGKTQINFFHLVTLFAFPLRKTQFFLPLLRAFEWMDSLLLKLPGLKWWAWQAVFILSEPRQ
jgi:ubiquinone/menaquinone biosynthesis C-methylase UbiE